MSTFISTKVIIRGLAFSLAVAWMSGTQTLSQVATEVLEVPAAKTFFHKDPFSTQPTMLSYCRDVDAAHRKLSLNDSQDAGPTGELWRRAIVDACDLYVAISLDPRSAASEPVQGRKRTLLARLRKTLKLLQKQQRQIEDARVTSERNKKSSSKDRPSPNPDVTVTDPMGDVAAPMESEVKLRRLQLELETELSLQWELAFRLSPGPGSLLSSSGGASVGNEGSNLIALIQSTITPGVWDVNGGNSSIIYYQRVHALVIRAPWNTHGDAQSLIQGLRR